jgi:hypothetical protein
MNPRVVDKIMELKMPMFLLLLQPHSQVGTRCQAQHNVYYSTQYRTCTMACFFLVDWDILFLDVTLICNADILPATI